MSILELRAPYSSKNFNEEVQFVLDDTIVRLLGRDVLDSLYWILREKYDVTPDEVPCRLETVFHVLFDVLDEPGVQTIQMVTAKRLYEKLALTFLYLDSFMLQAYVKQAKASGNSVNLDSVSPLRLSEGVCDEQPSSGRQQPPLLHMTSDFVEY